MERVTLRRAAMLLLGLVLCVLPGAAKAGGSEAFNEGMRLMAKGDFDGACTAFSRSEDPKPTMASRYQLGRCNEERQHYGSAYWAFVDAAAIAEQAGDNDRAKVARQRAREVETEAQSTRLVVVVKPASRIDGLSIKIDDHELPPDSWGKALPADPGKHTIAISAPGRQSAELSVTVSRGKRPAMVEIPSLATANGTATSASVGEGGSGATVGDGAPPPPDLGPKMVRKSNAAFWTGMGLIIGGGLAAIGGGVAWGNPNLDYPHEAAIGLWVLGGAMIAVGIPLMVVFGKKVPAKQPQAGAMSPSVAVEVLAQPTGGALRVRF